MSDSLTLYKLIVLYMLNKVTFPLTDGQISEFILGEGYTDYFNYRVATSELLDSSLIQAESIMNTSLYKLTDAGQEALQFFGNRISYAIQQDIDVYLKEHKLELRNEFSVVADYYKEHAEEYIVTCKVHEKDSDLISLTLNVPLKEQAEMICDNWKKKCQGIYGYLMKELM